MTRKGNQKYAEFSSEGGRVHNVRQPASVPRSLSQEFARLLSPLRRCPDGRSVRCRVQATRVIPKTDTSVLRQDAGNRLTLITCYPFDAIRPGTPLRWVVIAQKVA